MNTRIKFLSYFYLLFGFVCGFLFSTSLTKDISTIVAKFITLISLVILVVYGKQIELAFHNIDIQNWSILRTHSKIYFIVTRYVLFRGIVLFILFVFPALTTVELSKVIFIAAVSGFLLLASILIYFGREEWKNCEQEYTIQVLKNAGEQARIIQN